MLETYGSIGIVAGIAQTVYLGTAFLLGGLLLARAARSRELPQALLGLHLLLAMGVGYLLLSAAMVIEMHGEHPPAGLVPGLVGAGYAATIAGLGATLVFNVRVFRPGSWGALGLALGIGGVMGLGWIGYGAVEGFPARFEGLWLWIMMGGILGANAWVAFEPLRYHRTMRRRLALGLAEPLVVDRFRLWGLGSLARTGMVICGPAAVAVERGLGEAAALTASAAVLSLVSLLGLVTSLGYWLAFFPTPAYARWVERGALRIAR